jgi:hypothetical protein
MAAASGFMGDGGRDGGRWRRRPSTGSVSEHINGDLETAAVGGDHVGGCCVGKSMPTRGVERAPRWNPSRRETESGETAKSSRGGARRRSAHPISGGGGRSRGGGGDIEKEKEEAEMCSPVLKDLGKNDGLTFFFT